MLTTLGDAIKARLEGLGVFKVVEQGFSKRALQSPPSAVFFLSADEEAANTPYVTRKLTWEIALLASYLDPVKGLAQMNDLVDAVRPAFIHWLPVPAGCLPTAAPMIRYEGVEDTLLIYTVRVTMQAFPKKIL